ncbi:F-box domain containing protein [Beauveria brongniartii RCEF 3172]|uniref:F-box domain containing protein n=1 Tax=Beauveria brongniartii RCEF 3172 TaxID=1081107 RepID=A0A162LV49_9HYPO|nr:F-box domain containing protein [Beauveria brongniartii RCEF 3172]
MDTSQQISFSTAIAEWLSNNDAVSALNLPQDAASHLPQNAASHKAQYAASARAHDAASNLPPRDHVEAAEVQSSNSPSSIATTFYDVYSDGPNLPNLPVEIFGIIISQISRQDLRNLRLVCKQWEANASPYYFKDVVVPFRTQMLRSLSPDRDGKLQNLSNSMLSNGGRIFGEFGHIIRRFALSMELDEDTLEYPPPKPKQQVIRSYWGLYRWPHATYSRYQDVSGIENVADEFLHMKAALRCLSHVTELGLCSDAGLGFLSGPNIKARYNAIRHRVFQDPYGAKNKISLGSTPPSVVTVGDTLPASAERSREAGRVLQTWKMSMMEAMLRDAGFKEEEVLDALALLLKTEGKTSLADMDLAESHTPSIPKERVEGEYWDLLPAFQPIRSSLPWSINKRLPERTNYALVPAALTRAQKEMLLELEWAHRAMAQSFILSAIDCSIEGSFQHVTTLNIAKIPSSHLHILSRHDLWSSFPSLTSVSLGVVADWRRFHVSAPEMVDEVSVSPLDAVPLAHALIKDYISLEPKIESFHFEWICGGELASGCHQRSQHILPAPFFASPAAMARPAMANVGTDSTLLRLPYVKNLSLKNCWVAPHVLLQSLRDYALCSLERIEFEGVSLSVMPWVTADPPPRNLVDLGASFPTANMMMNFSQWESGLLSLKQPSWMSWAGLIEHFSPSAKIRDAIDRGKNATARASSAEKRQDTLEQLTCIIPDARELFKEEALYALESLTFKSCGYVNLDHERFHLGSMISSSELSLLSATLPTVSEFTPFMQRCNKNLVARIVNFEMANDRFPFARVFNFTMGWHGVYDSKIIDAAEADKCQEFGPGRFSGLLAKDVGVKPENSQS